MISDFEWQRGTTPLSSYSSVTACVVLYFTTVAILPGVLRKAMPVPTILSALHNVTLCFGSLIMFVGTAFEAVKVSLFSQM